MITNLGQTAATDVRVAWSAPLESAVLRPEHSPVNVPEAFPLLVPGQSWLTFWDTTQARQQASDLPERYVATVHYRDLESTELPPSRFEIDWRVLLDRGFVTVHTLSVMARDGDAVDEKRRQEW